MEIVNVETEKAASTEIDHIIHRNEREDKSMPLISNGVNYSELPQHYIRPPTERPMLDEVVLISDSIPIVDVGALLCDSTRPEVIRQIAGACAEYGFFQIINHGIPDTVSSRMLQVAEEFFTMPVEDRIEYYSDDPLRKTRLSTSFNIHKEQVFNWRDYLRHHCYPLEEHVHTWPSKPADYREVCSMYCREIRALALRLLEAISESLGLEADFLDKALGKHEQHMAVNYYPKCPNPELTFGLPAHSDPNVLTLLLQDEVPGLQVLNNGRWIAVNPIPNSFVINIGDQLQVLSNGRYRSVLHRAVHQHPLTRSILHCLEDSHMRNITKISGTANCKGIPACGHSRLIPKHQRPLLRRRTTTSKSLQPSNYGIYLSLFFLVEYFIGYILSFFLVEYLIRILRVDLV